MNIRFLEAVTYHWPETTESQINLAVAQWFRNVEDRNGGRVKRRRSTTDEPNNPAERE